jgi:hypothetical protein
MLGYLARFLISRSADDGRALPGWVHKRMQRDSTLAAYDRQCRGLVNRLREEAHEWTQNSQSFTFTSASTCDNRFPQPTRLDHAGIKPFPGRRFDTPASSLRMAGVIALTAVLLISVVTVWAVLYQPGDRGQRLVQGTGRSEQVDGEIDMQPVVASWVAGEEVVRKVSMGARRVWKRTTSHSAMESIREHAALASAGGRVRQVRQDLSGRVRRIMAALAEMKVDDSSHSTPPAH